MARTRKRPAPLKPVHHLIVLLLAEEPTFGVELMERLEGRSGGTVKLNAGSLYRTIARLVDDGLVEPVEPVKKARPDGRVRPESYTALPCGAWPHCVRKPSGRRSSSQPRKLSIF